ncbi:uncharacterized protein LOC132520324 [Lagenorhynchus albirostris]|uniref:uncharacterized protein LOC132520324 n=1 Tax=Lagenorhynchus albirostris TaxID=27610 RepID=UPI0028E842B9|nr:uncharacterized protein LOC132520324 [Lagenorhynchus albirostris]
MAGSSKPPLNCTPRPRAAVGSEGAARPRTRGAPTRRPTRRVRGEVGPRPRRPLPGTGVRARPRRQSPPAGPCLLFEVDSTLHRAVALQHAYGLRHHDSRGRAPVHCEDQRRSGKPRRGRQRKPRTQHRAEPRHLYMPGRRTPPTLARNQSPPAFSARPPRDASGRESPGAGPKGCLGRLAFRAAGSLRPAPVKRPETWNGEKQQPFSSKGCSPWIAVHKIRKMRQPVRMNKQFTVCHSGIPGDENRCLGTSVVKSKSSTYEPSCKLSKRRTCVPSTSGVSRIAALRLLLLTTLQLYHLPPPLPPPVSNSSCLFTRCQPLDASCCSVLLYFSRLAVAVRFPVLLFSQVGFFFMPVTWAQRLDSSSKVGEVNYNDDQTVAVT